MMKMRSLPPLVLVCQLVVVVLLPIANAAGHDKYVDGGSLLRRHLSPSHSKDDTLTNAHLSSSSSNNGKAVDEELDDFEDPDVADFAHDFGKRQYDDYGHLRFGKRGPGSSDDYGHLRFGKRSRGFGDYGHMRFGKRNNNNNNNDDDDYGHLRFGR